MKVFKKIFTDPAFYILALLNLFFIYEYKDDPEKYTTIIWLFWCQSVLIGLFNFAELLSAKNIDAKGFRMNGRQVDPQKERGCYSWFFLFHFEFFHLGYFIFLGFIIGLKNIDTNFLKLSLIAVIVSQAILFIRHKQESNIHPPSFSSMFFLPYLRIIPMHLMILLPAFFHFKPAMVFLILKAFFDLMGYVITTKWYWKNRTS